jgi:cytochrome c553
MYTTKQLKAFKEGKRQHEQMSLIAKSLSDQDIADLAAWYAGLKVTVEMPP